MSKPVIRVTDRDSSNHDMVEGSPNVSANNLKICRQGDKDSSNHPIQNCLSTVTVNGIPVARNQDKDSNDDTESSNSTVLCGP